MAAPSLARSRGCSARYWRCSFSTWSRKCAMSPSLRITSSATARRCVARRLRGEHALRPRSRRCRRAPAAARAAAPGRSPPPARDRSARRRRFPPAAGSPRSTRGRCAASRRASVSCADRRMRERFEPLSLARDPRRRARAARGDPALPSGCQDLRAEMRGDLRAAAASRARRLRAPAGRCR